MATIHCPYCDIEVNENAIEGNDGCCPECGAAIIRGSLYQDDYDEDDDEFDYDDDEFDFDDDLDDDLDYDDDDLELDEDLEDLDFDEDFDDED